MAQARPGRASWGWVDSLCWPNLCDMPRARPQGGDGNRAGARAGVEEGRTGKLTRRALGPSSAGDCGHAGAALRLGPWAVVARGTELTIFPRRCPWLCSEGAQWAEKGTLTTWTPVAWRTQVAFEGGETCSKNSRQGRGAAWPVPPKPLASSLESALHLGTRRGARQARDGTPPGSGLLPRPGTCALGRPGGSPCLQGSSGRPGREGQLGPLQSKGNFPSQSPSSQGASHAVPFGTWPGYLTGFAPVPGGARLEVLLLLGPRGGCHGVRRAQGELPTALWAVKTLRSQGAQVTLGPVEGRGLPRQAGSSCPEGLGDSAGPRVERSGHQSWFYLLSRMSHQSPSDLLWVHAYTTY